MALPPFLNISAPTLAALGSLVVTTPPLPPGTPKKGESLLKQVLEENITVTRDRAKTKIRNFGVIDLFIITSIIYCF
jgi:hypothetical protein